VQKKRNKAQTFFGFPLKEVLKSLVNFIALISLGHGQRKNKVGGQLEEGPDRPLPLFSYPLEEDICRQPHPFVYKEQQVQ